MTSSGSVCRTAKNPNSKKRGPTARIRWTCWPGCFRSPKPEATEAEKLVDAWLVSCGIVRVEDYGDFVRLAQFILDRVNAQLTFPSTEGITATERPKFTVDQWQANTLPEGPFRIVDENGREIASGFTSSLKASPEDVKAVSDAIRNVMEPVAEPQYVYGPWIKWHGGECPVPGDWMVETVYRKETIEKHDDRVIAASEYNNGRWRHNRASSQHEITHYRVRFTVGQWYDWAGGDECPVGKDMQVEVGLRNGSTNSTYSNPTFYRWTHGIYSPSDLHDIVKFRVIAP